MPEKFTNKTNGVTHRRWLLAANPELAKLITNTIGPEWVRQPKELGRLLPFADDSGFRQKLAAVKQERKQALAKFVGDKYGIRLDTCSIFDVQVKRIHIYKRQLLNISGLVSPLQIYNGNEQLRQCVNQLADGSLSVIGDEFKPLYDYLLYGSGEFCELADFAAYLDAQAKIDALFRNDNNRWRIAATNIACSGVFSSDNTIREYAQGIWNVRISSGNNSDKIVGS